MSGLKRVKYFEGQFLTASEMEAEQSYHIEKCKRHNRWALGAGVVSGLEVTVDPGSSASAPAVTVSPGLAIDAEGNELAVEAPLRSTLDANLPSGYVMLRYCEKLTDFVPDASGATQPSRVEEGVRLEFSANATDTCVALARLVFTRGKWKLDPKFKVQKIKR